MKILFTGGGTLGHIYPTFPVIRKLKEEGNEIYFIGGMRKNEEELLIGNKDIDRVFLIDLQGFKRKISLYNLTTLKKYFKSIKKVEKILADVKPDVVIGMGGYVSAPVIKAALKKKIKVILHEQNSVYGLVNRIFKNKVNKVLLSYDMNNGEKIAVVGNPRTSEFYNKYKNSLYAKSVFGDRILVVGGSLGSEKINDYFIKNSENFKEKKIDVVLVTGKKYYEKNIDLIEKSNSSSFNIIPFTDRLSEYMINAKLIISRSGATTLAEIMGLKKISILIPSPNVTGNHQYKNAVYYQEKGCAILVEENKIEEELFEKIISSLNDKGLSENIKKNIESAVVFNSTEKFYKEIIDVVNHEN